uniref:Pyroglutamyl-peptidase I like n=1 Tax=Felis catus TaxID=9685 RepID=A0ABI7WIN1_FELCA
MDSQSSCVMATRFGPFRQHLVNSSWEAVKELSKLGPNSRREVGLRVLQLPVDYREVMQRVTRIWEDLQPQLVVHNELDASAKAMVLEQRAKNRGSWDADIRGFRPARGEGLPDGPEVIASGVSTRALSKLVTVEGAQVVYSRNAGRYVCDYTCYLSLHQGNGRTALVRVPPLSCWLQDVLDEMRKPELKAQ